MENKWQLILHDKQEDPYYEITNGPISLIANCGIVGEDDADEENIFNRVKDELNTSGVRFHSGNALELTRHIEIQKQKYEIAALQAKCEQQAQDIEQYKEIAKDYGHASDKIFQRDKEIEELQAKCDRYEKALDNIQHAPMPANANEAMIWVHTAHNIANEALNGEEEKPAMQFNSCKTCGAGNGRAGLLINDECLNCYETRKTGAVTIHTNLERTQDEIDKTILVLNQKEGKQ